MKNPFNKWRERENERKKEECVKNEEWKKKNHFFLFSVDLDS